MSLDFRNDFSYLFGAVAGLATLAGALLPIIAAHLEKRRASSFPGPTEGELKAEVFLVENQPKGAAKPSGTQRYPIGEIIFEVPHAPVPAPAPAAAGPRPEKQPARRNRSPLLGIALFMLVVVVGVAMYWKGASPRDGKPNESTGQVTTETPSQIAPVPTQNGLAESATPARSSWVQFLFATTPGLHLCVLTGTLLVLVIWHKRIVRSFRRQSAPTRILTIFGVLAVGFALSAAITFRASLTVRPGDVYRVVAMFIAMICGMFVQVIGGNISKNHKALRITTWQLVFPILYSPFVFYPVLAMTSDATQLRFLLYASFVNGYFWESVVASVKDKYAKNPLIALPRTSRAS